MFKNILVTGGCGFIGSNFINYMVKKYPDINFINIDKLDYCATVNNITVTDYNNYVFIKGDILDTELVYNLLIKYNIDSVVHFAAYTHVDNSFWNSLEFTMNNIVGTHKLLENIRKYDKDNCIIKKFIHVSTDEVYGEIEISDGKYHEQSMLNPTNPYAATKAGAEFIVKSYYKSFKIPIIITRGNNVFGPNQYPDKIVPKFTNILFDNKKCTIQGSGKHTRNFIYVLDTVKAFETILFKGEINETYNIGTNNEYSVLEIAKILIKKIKNTESYDDYITYIEDRPFNDIRYAITCDKLKNLGWSETCNFENSLDITIDWYKNHKNHFN